MKLFNFILLLLIGLFALDHAISPATLINKAKKYHQVIKTKPNSNNPADPPQAPYNTSYFTQIIDHYDYYYSPNSKTWSQRYIWNSQYWKKGGPIFFYCGNEGDITQFWANSGFLTITLPVEFNAYILFAEHRYFGESMPFGNESYTNKNLKYLTTEQALADYVVFLRHFKTHIINCTDCPIIAFGGSYGGMLAAWIRMKFPNVIDGALAASAPILYFKDVTPLEGFYEICTNDYNQTQVPDCANIIQEGFRRLTNYSNNPTAYEYVNSLINPPPCQLMNNSDDIYNIFESYLSNAYTYLCMTDYPYETTFLSNLPPWPVNYSCWAFTGLTVNSSDEEIIGAMVKAAKIFYDYDNETTCTDIYQDTYINPNTSDMYGWDILACNEMVLPMSSDGIHDMFYPSPWNDTAYAISCNETYEQIPRETWAIDFYGGWDIYEDFRSYSNIFFSNGKLDPWSAGGVLVNLSDSLIAYYINDAAHHLDLRLPNPADPEDVTIAREMEITYIRKWIQEKYETNEANKRRRNARSGNIQEEIEETIVIEVY